nr:DJ-1 family glyoxalase III [uncultured Oribacterium sp.]
MKKVLAFFAEGTEEIECLMVVDILRRAGVSVELIAVAPENLVKGSHQITILCDKNISELSENDFSASDLLFLPGGIPGVPHLEENKSLLDALEKQFQAGKDLAAICAAPGIFGRLGFLKEQDFTCYPGFEEGISGVEGAKWSGKAVEVGKQIITGRGMGVALDFALALVERLESAEKAAQLKKGVQHPECI